MCVYFSSTSRTRHEQNFCEQILLSIYWWWMPECGFACLFCVVQARRVQSILVDADDKTHVVNFMAKYRCTNATQSGQSRHKRTDMPKKYSQNSQRTQNIRKRNLETRLWMRCVWLMCEANSGLTSEAWSTCGIQQSTKYNSTSWQYDTQYTVRERAGCRWCYCLHVYYWNVAVRCVRWVSCIRKVFFVCLRIRTKHKFARATTIVLLYNT